MRHELWFLKLHQLRTTDFAHFLCTDAEISLGFSAGPVVILFSILTHPHSSHSRVSCAALRIDNEVHQPASAAARRPHPQTPAACSHLDGFTPGLLPRAAGLIGPSGSTSSVDETIVPISHTVVLLCMSSQVLKGDIRPAIETHEMLYQVTKKHNFLPEVSNWIYGVGLEFPLITLTHWSACLQAFTTDFRVHWAQHPLRPEFAESTYFLYKVIYQAANEFGNDVPLDFLFNVCNELHNDLGVIWIFWPQDIKSQTKSDKRKERLLIWSTVTKYSSITISSVAPILSCNAAHCYPGHRRPLLPGGRSHHHGQPQPLCPRPLRLCGNEGCSHWQPRGQVRTRWQCLYPELASQFITQLKQL